MIGHGREVHEGLPFDKVEACGNDFVLLDKELDGTEISAICDRHHGIGADGILLFRDLDGTTVFLDHYDPDGSRSFCLNGVRSALSCLYRKGAVPRRGSVQSEGVRSQYEIGKSTGVFLEKVDYEPLLWRGADTEVPGFRVDVGNPQFVLTHNMTQDRFLQLAPVIRHDRTTFPAGTNVNLVRPVVGGFAIKTFERGVEGFTKACGSGMIASALVLMGEEELDEIRFFPDGKGTVLIRDWNNSLHIEGDTHWVASGVWLC